MASLAGRSDASTLSSPFSTDQSAAAVQILPVTALINLSVMHAVSLVAGVSVLASLVVVVTLVSEKPRMLALLASAARSYAFEMSTAYHVASSAVSSLVHDTNATLGAIHLATLQSLLAEPVHAITNASLVECPETTLPVVRSAAFESLLTGHELSGAVPIVAHHSIALGVLPLAQTIQPTAAIVVRRIARPTLAQSFPALLLAVDSDTLEPRIA